VPLVTPTGFYLGLNDGGAFGSSTWDTAGPKWSAKAEYLYVNLGKLNCGFNCGARTDNASFSANIVRGGINYRKSLRHTDWGPPPAPGHLPRGFCLSDESPRTGLDQAKLTALTL